MKKLAFSVSVLVGLSGVSFSNSAVACSADPILGSICLFGFNFCPRGWAEANGAILQISQNEALYSLFGTTYGGDGRITFALPDLRGRVPINAGAGPGLSVYNQGKKGGAEQVALTVGQLPAHNHSATLRARTDGGNTEIPSNNRLANSRRSAIYSDTGGTLSNLATDSIAVSNSGSGQDHENRMPYLALKYCVATVGIYPSRN